MSDGRMELVFEDSAADLCALRLAGGEIAVCDYGEEIRYGTLPPGSDRNTILAAMAFYRSGYAVGVRVGRSALQCELRNLLEAAERQGE